MDTILQLLESYRLLATFVGSLLFGDSVIITVAYLAGSLSWSVPPVFFAAVAGSITADMLWFVFGKYLAHHGSKITYFEKQRGHITNVLGKLTGEKLHLWLIYIKFLYGGRIAMILYAASRGMSYKTFTIYNGAGHLLWFVIFFPLGYLAGRGLSKAMPLFNVLEAGLIVLVASFIAVRLFNIWLTRRIEKQQG